MTPRGQKRMLKELTHRKNVHRDSVVFACLFLLLKEKKKKDNDILNFIKKVKEADTEIYEALYEYCWNKLSLNLP